MPAACLAFLGGAVGGPEVLVIAIAALILFGPKRLPEIARTLGRAIAQLRQSAQDFKNQVTREAEESAEPPNALAPGRPSLPPGEGPSAPATTEYDQAVDKPPAPVPDKEKPRMESHDGLAG